MSRYNYQISNIQNRPRQWELQAIQGEQITLTVDWRAFLASPNLIQSFTVYTLPATVILTVPTFDATTETATQFLMPDYEFRLWMSVVIGPPSVPPETFIAPFRVLPFYS